MCFLAQATLVRPEPRGGEVEKVFVCEGGGGEESNRSRQPVDGPSQAAGPRTWNFADPVRGTEIRKGQAAGNT